MNRMHLRCALLIAVAIPACAPVGVATASPLSGQMETSQEQAGEQPGSDAWITTKVKAKLLATRDVHGMDIRVETRGGMVLLSGHVASQAEADRAVAAAKEIEGVVSVDDRKLVVGTPAPAGR